MKKLFYSMFVAFGALAMASCAVDNTTDGTFSNVERTVKFSASFDNTRTTYDTDLHKLSWAEGDTFDVFAVSEDGSMLEFFHGLAYDNASATLPAGTAKVYAFYPSYDYTVEDFDDVTFDINGIQGSNDYLPMNLPLYDVAEVTGDTVALLFKQMTAIVELNVYGGEEGDILFGYTFTADGQDCAGTFTFDWKNEKLAATELSADTSDHYVEPEPTIDGTDKANGTKVYLAVPKAVYGSAKISLTVEHQNSTYDFPVFTFENLDMNCAGRTFNLNIGNSAEPEGVMFAYDVDESQATLNKVEPGHSYYDEYKGLIGDNTNVYELVLYTNPAKSKAEYIYFPYDSFVYNYADYTDAHGDFYMSTATFEFSHDETKWMTFESADDNAGYFWKLSVDYDSAPSLPAHRAISAYKYVWNEEDGGYLEPEGDAKYVIIVNVVGGDSGDDEQEEEFGFAMPDHIDDAEIEKVDESHALYEEWKEMIMSGSKVYKVTYNSMPSGFTANAYAMFNGIPVCEFDNGSEVEKFVRCYNNGVPGLEEEFECQYIDYGESPYVYIPFDFAKAFVADVPAGFLQFMDNNWNSMYVIFEFIQHTTVYGFTFSLESNESDKAVIKITPDDNEVEYLVDYTTWNNYATWTPEDDASIQAYFLSSITDFMPDYYTLYKGEIEFELTSTGGKKLVYAVPVELTTKEGAWGGDPYDVYEHIGSFKDYILVDRD